MEINIDNFKTLIIIMRKYGHRDRLILFLSITVSDILNIFSLQATVSDGGTYKVLATNNQGQATTTFKLNLDNLKTSESL